ncbi:hypothetical protein IGK73_000037 [Enterococcus sp. AZ102]
MKLTTDELLFIEELIDQYISLYPQLSEVQFDEDGKPYEYLNGEKCYDSFGPKKTLQIHQLSVKLNSLV